MCGIAGKIYFDKNRSVQLSDLKRMTDTIIHRGPDDEGYLIDDFVGLGFRRLSIIDLKSGHQPLCDNKKRYWITFNGEIYNFGEIRVHLEKKGYFFRTKTDTEVIVNLYAEYKENCLDFLRGMFAFVIWDKKEKILFGARDRFGIKPFYYYLGIDGFVWGSEIKAIIASGSIDTTLNLTALDYYFAYGYTPRNQSIYLKIKKLEPAHYFILKPLEKEKIIIKSYWEINFEPDYSRNEEYWKEAILDTLNQAVKMRMISDVPLGAFLSGGIDSSIVVSLMALNSNKPIKTFSIGFKEDKFNELKYANQLAERYKTNHLEFIIKPDSIDLLPKLVRAYDEPFADSSAIPTYYVSKYTREHVTVALSGDGGDELFAGYNSYPKMLSLYNAIYNNRLTNKAVFGIINKLIPEYFYGKGYSYFLSKNKFNLGAFFCVWKDYERRKLYNINYGKKLELVAESLKIDKIDENISDFISRMQKLDMQTYMVDSVLTKVDRASMINSLEVRVPLLDHKVAELSFRIPSTFKISSNYQKLILKDSAKKLLPQQVYSHKKQGFTTPLELWFKKELREYMNDRLLNNNSPLFNYLDMKYVGLILKYHQKGIRDFSSKIWSLLIFDEWLMQKNSNSYKNYDK